MTAPRHSQAAVERLVDQLSLRDRSVLVDLARVRVLTGDHLTRLHFHDLAATSRDRTRRRVLARLAELDLVSRLERTVGGVRAGSSGHVYALGVVGQRVLALLDAAAETGGGLTARARRPWTPGQLFLKHTLAISELYVQLTELCRAGLLTLGRFEAEPAAWWPDGGGGLLKPDASVCVALGEFEDSWFVEVDRATESPETLRRKLVRYVDFARAGQLGPDGVTPRVLVTVPHERRLQDVRAVLARLPPPTDRLFAAIPFNSAVGYLVEVLRE
ncbi:replication-relaxation family protein [Pseudofrankia sp. DC12]|uniref:replication-relaxation family protein n=1 Tax=Pseudofrankia sp. DC12 TaxID=683315 RepID=UPI0005F77AC4|nr:replication-relaxation family protein [Pseudofrankia sp. DC12]